MEKIPGGVQMGEGARMHPTLLLSLGMARSSLFEVVMCDNSTILFNAEIPKFKK
jgi:hypothetical protein